VSDQDDKKALVPSAVVSSLPISQEPIFSPQHSMVATREIAGGLTSQAEDRIATLAGEGDMAQAQAAMQKLAAFQEFLKQLAFSKLRNHDFCKFSSVSDNEDDDGKPWLRVGAAERVAETCGIAYGVLGMDTEEGEDSQGPYFIRRARMWFKVGGRYIETIGEIDSRDGLLSSGGKLSAAQVPRTKMGQKAISRATQIGIGKVLGLRDLTWERVAELTAGSIDPKKVQGAKFKKGRQGGGLDTGEDTDSATSGQFASVYRAWGKATGRSTERDAFKGNMDPFGQFINGVFEDPPDTRMRPWSAYKLGEVRKLMKAVEDLAAQKGSQ
jgi:hypothetical protein